MGSQPNIGKGVFNSMKDAFENAFSPTSEVLGEIKAKPPEMPVWDDPVTKAQIALEEGPPPWEKLGEDSSNARQFVSCPDDWVLYWINPRQLDASGWRGWQAVKTADQRVKVLVPSMRSPEGFIRRGGPNGDILGYMPRHWYEQRRQDYARMVAQQTQSSLDRMESMREDFRSGKYPGIELQSSRHPTHTMAEIRNPTD